LPLLSCRHLKDLLADQARCEALTKEDLGLYIDFSRQRATQDTIKVR
jgi:glucose-6-phosphate isomerase